MHYIDLNPKRAGMVDHPEKYKWTSYRYYAYGEPDPLLTPAPSYVALGITDEERQACYRGMVEEILKNDWKEKKSYSSAQFIGNPDWVIEKKRRLSELVAANRAEIRDRAELVTSSP
jgi:putative transposase